MRQDTHLSRGDKGATCFIEDVIAIHLGVSYGRIASFETEHVGTHEAVVACPPNWSVHMLVMVHNDRFLRRSEERTCAIQ